MSDVVLNTHRSSREEIAQREIGHTEISAGLARVMTVVFLLTLAGPPMVQLVYELLFSNKQIPSCLAFHLVPDARGPQEHVRHGLWNKVTAANRRLQKSIEGYERQLEERSLLTTQLLGPAQYALTRWAKVGNEQAYPGLRGWLCYRPDVDSLTGPGFLEPAVLHRRSLASSHDTVPVQPDPRPAILEFQRQLLQRGIRLILVPTPSKPAIHPEMLSSRYAGPATSLENSSFQQFRQEMQQAGILVFDPAPILKRRQAASPDGPGSIQYLQTDTHWTPEAMDEVARELAAFVKKQSLLPEREPLAYREQTRTVRNLGDIARMLQLPADQDLFSPETVTIREVTAPDGANWKPDERSDVLLLGDSYTNLFSLPEMGWGTQAGLAERLSFSLQRSVDRLAQNDGGAHAVRQSLQQEMLRGYDRLQGKRVVIWQFAARELAVGDWRSFPIPAADRTGGPPAVTPTANGELVVRATVRTAAGVPQPGSVPYRDAVTSVHLTDVEGAKGPFPHRQIVVYVWGLRDNVRTKAANWLPDRQVTLRLIPWDAAREKYGRFNRVELDDPDFELAELPTYWAEELP